MQASLAIVGASAGVARCAIGGGLGWLVGSVLLGAVVPFTLVVMLPTNNRLLDSNLDKASPDAEALLARWARLHAVTSEWRAIASRTAKVPMHPGVEKILQQFDVRST